MGYRRLLVLALACSSFISEACLGQIEDPPQWATDSKGCKFASPFGKGPAPAPDTILWSGECQDGYFSGAGTLMAADGSILKGDFVAGSITRGVLELAGGKRYEGQFKGNRAEGRGTLQESPSARSN